jgi:hypothetical protein
MFMVGGSAMMFHLSKSMFKPFQQGIPQQQQQAQQQQSSQQKREMRGPGIDLMSLGKGLDISNILGSLQQAQMMNQVASGSQASGDEMSDIISIGSEVKDLELNTQSMDRKKRRRSNKKELVL